MDLDSCRSAKQRLLLSGYQAAELLFMSEDSAVWWLAHVVDGTEQQRWKRPVDVSRTIDTLRWKEAREENNVSTA